MEPAGLRSTARRRAQRWTWKTAVPSGSMIRLPAATASWLVLPVESGIKHSTGISQILFGGCSFASQQNLAPPLTTSTYTRSEHYDTLGVLALSWVNKLYTHHLSYPKDSQILLTQFSPTLARQMATLTPQLVDAMLNAT